MMDTPAPWAGPVRITAEELLQMPEDGWRYELAEGRLVRMSPTGFEHGLFVMVLLRAVDQDVESQNMGVAVPPETGFLVSHTGGPDTVLAPGLALLARGRVSVPATGGYQRTTPDLVAEVVSPSQGRVEMGAKARRWLDAGVRLVWIVLPETQTVEVWRPEASVRTLTTEDQMSGEDVLPGFTLPVANLFA